MGRSIFSFSQNGFQFHPKIKFAITGVTNFSDFELTPPKKIIGLIVIKEDIEINFNIIVENTI
jgi:hypothetical protein